MPVRALLAISALLLVLVIGCPQRAPSSSSRGNTNTGMCDPASPGCADGQVCEAHMDGIRRCVGPLVIRGQVIRITDSSPIEGALVQAVDINGAAVGTSGVSAADGSYEITVPALRDADGNPLQAVYTLRVQAADYIEFPTAIRPALPLDAATAFAAEDRWTIENSLTTVALIPLPGDTSELGSISGRVNADSHAGVLVVAEGSSATLTGFSNSEGEYTVFNVPAGNYTVQGYFAGLQLDATSTSVAAGEDQTGIDLSHADRPLSSVSGNVQIVNAPGGSVTSVILAVESTFAEAAGRGAVPPGLRVGDVTGAFTIDGVPDGRYVVLAAFENDNLVRDPDLAISGTDVVHITVPDPVLGNTITFSEGFKVTGALNVVAPGTDQPEQIATPTPTLQWADDSSEDGYIVRVFDSFGNEVWNTELGNVTGSPTVMLTYAGPPLQPGMFYQFRVTSFRDTNNGRSAISQTEDLKGVFYYLNP
jgi:hypothetical protein